MNENKPLVSVIVPVYNAEKYLAQAIESVLNQMYENFELILVNDRSNDKSVEICEKYAQSDNRIILHDNNTENHGPGPARNIGLDLASGEFILFMDADDWIDESLLETAVCRMLETNSDIVQFGFACEREGKIPEECCRNGKDILTREDIKDVYLKENRLSLWMHLFNKKTVKSIRFEHILIGEDICYLLDAFANAEKCAYISKALYHYRVIDGSASHRWIENTVWCREIIWKHQKNYLSTFGEDDTVLAHKAYGNYIWTIYLLSQKSCPLSYPEKKRQLARFRENTEFDKYRKYCPQEKQHGVNKVKYIMVKYRLEKLLLLFGPLFLKIVRGE